MNVFQGFVDVINLHKYYTLHNMDWKSVHFCTLMLSVFVGVEKCEHAHS